MGFGRPGHLARHTYLRRLEALALRNSLLQVSFFYRVFTMDSLDLCPDFSE